MAKPIHHSDDEERADILVNILLDRSGSMSSLIGDVIGHYNSYIRSLKSQNARVSLVIFDTTYQEVYLNKPAKQIGNLTKDTYYARGGTALLDAVGKLIHSVDAIKNKPSKIVFVINTDGYENSSKEFTKARIKELITERQDNHDWQFVFIGAGIDAFSEGASLGVHYFSTASVPATPRGYADAYSTLTSATFGYAGGQSAFMDMTGPNTTVPVDATNVNTTIEPKKKRKGNKIASTR